MAVIERRYQRRSRDGIVWTNWFRYREYSDINEAKKNLKVLKAQKEADKKLLGEYRIVEE